MTNEKGNEKVITLRLRRTLDDSERDFYIDRGLDWNPQDLEHFACTMDLYLCAVSIAERKFVEPTAALQPRIDLDKSFFEWLETFLSEDSSKHSPQHTDPFQDVFALLYAVRPSSVSELQAAIPDVVDTAMPSASVEERLRIAAAFGSLFGAIDSIVQPGASTLGAVYLLLLALFIRELKPEEIVRILRSFISNKE